MSTRSSNIDCTYGRSGLVPDEWSELTLTYAPSCVACIASLIAEANTLFRKIFLFSLLFCSSDLRYPLSAILRGVLLSLPYSPSNGQQERRSCRHEMLQAPSNKEAYLNSLGRTFILIVH